MLSIGISRVRIISLMHADAPRLNDPKFLVDGSSGKQGEEFYQPCIN